MSALGRVACLLLVILAAPAGADSIPHPELDGLEAAVAEQIRGLRANAERAGDEEPTQQALHYAELGALYHSLGFLDAALASYRHAESRAPDDGRWPYLQGVVHTDLGELQNARYALLRAIALKPDLAAGWVRLGRLAMNDGDASGALLHFRRALGRMPESPAALAGAGQALLELGRAREAAEHLERALNIEPRADRLHYPLAMAYRSLGQQEKMRAHLEQVGPIGVTADDPIAEYATHRIAGARAHIQQGNKAYRAGDYAAAVTYFTRATEANPDEAAAWTNLGAAQGAAGDLAAARQSFERALEIAPGSTTALENLVAVLLSEKDESTALSLLNGRLPPDSEHRGLLYRRAELRRLNDNPSGAANDFERLTELVPDEAPAWMGLIIARIEAGELNRVQGVLADAGKAMGDLSSFKGELIDALTAVHDGDPAEADLAHHLAVELYNQNPRSDNAMRVARTLLLGDAGCTAARRWLDEQVDDGSVDKAPRGELAAIRNQLEGLERCAEPESSGPED